MEANPQLHSEELHSYMKQQVEAYWRCVNDTGDSLWCVFSWHYWKYLNPPVRHSYSKSEVILLLQESAYYANLHQSG